MHIYVCIQALQQHEFCSTVSRRDAAFFLPQLASCLLLLFPARPASFFPLPQAPGTHLQARPTPCRPPARQAAAAARRAPPSHRLFCNGHLAAVSTCVARPRIAAHKTCFRSVAACAGRGVLCAARACLCLACCCLWIVSAGRAIRPSFVCVLMVYGVLLCRTISPAWPSSQRVVFVY